MEPLTFWQRRAMKSLVKYARKRPDEQLSPEDWESYIRFSAQPRNRAFKRVLRAMPSTPRCGFCGAPFAGMGGRMVRPLGYRPSRKNPNVCATCVELAPPGGLTTDVGVLFVDLRGFTAQSEGITPAAASAGTATLLCPRGEGVLPRGTHRQADRRRGHGALPAGLHSTGLGRRSATTTADTSPR